ncbi:MAG: transporter [Mycetocola sp.]|nr:transporter [Mycetocola sp.]
MSSLLYSLGRWAFHARGIVVGAWLLILALIGGGALVFNQGLDNAISIPGTESQAALDSLKTTFPQVSGASAQLAVVAPAGDTVSEGAVKDVLNDGVDALNAIPGVANAVSPFDENIDGAVSENERAAIISIQLEDSQYEVTAATKEALVEEADAIAQALPDGSESALGGQLFSTSLPVLTATELIGVGVALLVLIFTFGSVLAAGMPLVTALLGVGISIAFIFLATAFGSITSTTPMLALMLGLAVGIDYALFIISRYQEQLRGGSDTEEAAARSVATAGSAVIFAGLTVIIALVGLGVAGIPFLTVMGVSAAVGVAITVLISITLIPALLGFAGERLRPKPGKTSRAKRKAHGAAATEQTVLAPPVEHRPNRFFAGWVTAATRFPIVTILGVVAILGLVSAPALGLRLALPDAGGLPADDPARVTYDLISDNFGEGFNGPLIVTGSIVTSTDPLGLMDDLKTEIEKLDGVAAVPLATPNETADTGIVQVIPSGGPDSVATKDLVAEIRSMHDYFLDEYDVDLSVTGFTAVGIDISDKLGGALLPFGVIVVGLSLVLLTMVFRSVWVPIKATLGYLLSVCASFGVVALVFEYGWFAEALHITPGSPVISFMPIILMGVLFGLAMDYEVFLVARMREDYVHSGKARESIRTGFLGSAKVVTAAAIIMFAVFAAFVPEGDTNIKPIALGLAVGVFVDAFIVRMTLVPAVLALLGEKAWWIPRWLDRALPSFDVEGEGVAKEIELRDWPAAASNDIATAEGLTSEAGNTRLFDDVSFSLPQGGTMIVSADREASVTALLLTLSGRMTADAGILKVAGYVAGVRAASVRSRAAFVSLSEAADPVRDLTAALREKPRLIALDGIDQVTDAVTRRNIHDVLLSARSAATARDTALAIAVGTAFPETLADAVPGAGSAVRIDLTPAELTHEAEVSA